MFFGSAGSAFIEVDVDMLARGACPLESGGDTWRVCEEIWGLLCRACDVLLSGHRSILAQVISGRHDTMPSHHVYHALQLP